MKILMNIQSYLKFVVVNLLVSRLANIQFSWICDIRFKDIKVKIDYTSTTTLSVVS